MQYYLVWRREVDCVDIEIRRSEKRLSVQSEKDVPPIPTMLLIRFDGSPPIRRPQLRRRNRILKILHLQIPHRARFTKQKDPNPA